MLKKYTKRILALVCMVALLTNLTPVFALPDIINSDRWPELVGSSPVASNLQYTFDNAYYTINEYSTSDYLNTTLKKYADNMSSGGYPKYDSTANQILFEVNHFVLPANTQREGFSFTRTLHWESGMSTEEKKDYYLPQMQYILAEADGIERRIPQFSIAIRESRATYSQDDITQAIALVPRFLNLYRDAKQLIEEIMAYPEGSAKVGDYHPIHAYMVFQAMKDITSTFTSVAVLSGTNESQAWVEEQLYGSIIKKESVTNYEPEQLSGLLDQFEFYINYAKEHPIDEPDITSFRLAGSAGVTDTETHTITVYFPSGFDTSVLTDDNAVIETNGWTYPRRTDTDGFSNGATYNVVAYDETSSVTYDGQNGKYFEFWGDVQQEWAIKIETGDPVTQLTSFAVTTSDGKTRYAEIDHGEKTVVLNLPYGTDLTNLAPTVAHTGTSISTIPNDYTNEQKITVSTVVGGQPYSAEYTVKITANKSAENKILSFKAADATGVVDHDSSTVTVEVPYGTDLTALQPEIEVSEFAMISPASGAQQDFSKGAVSYTVTAENGSKKTYQVTVAAVAADADTRILSFSYQGMAGTIDTAAGTVKLEVPAGTNLTSLAPTITVAATSSISPASGVAQDFSNGAVTYTVTAQSGATQTYQVEITHSAADVDKALVERMETLLDKIITRYKTTSTNKSDDWEFMNIGFYDHITRAPGDALPTGFDVAERALNLSRTKMTDYERGIMMFTALGIDATKLDEYAGRDIIYSDSNGTIDISNMVEQLYNYPVEDTINGPIFYLNAVNMGNYTVPADAKWTREDMLNKILAHEYGTDGFQLDMVAMLMQAIAPYQNQYPAVQTKLNEGLDIILGNKSAPGVVGMKPGYIFYSTGFDNSEVTAQVICALCAMGIDPHTDPRFSDGNGKSVITVWLDQYANEADGYFHHTTEVTNNAMATYQSCYALQWYLNFLKNGGAGHPYSLYYDNGFDFSKELSTDAAILSFTLNGQVGTISGDQITVKFPAEESMTDLQPIIELSSGARLIAPSLPVTFINGVAQPFTVQAEDGSTQQTYYVTVTKDESVLPANTSFDLSEAVIKDHDQYTLDAATIRGTEAEDGAIELLITVPSPADPAKLRVTLPLPYGATSDLTLDGKKNLDLSDWVSFTVTAGNGTTQAYRIKAVQEKLATIEKFSLTINGTEYTGEITRTQGDAWNISITGVPSNASLSSLIPNITLGEGVAVCSPLQTLAQDFRSSVTYTVSGEDLTTQTYTVTVSTTGSADTSQPVDTSAKITSFILDDVEGVIDHAAGTITLEVNYYKDLTKAAPEVKVNSGCTVNPVSGQVVNLSMPIVYTVSNSEGQKRYTVIVNRVKSPAQQLWDAVAEEMDPESYQTSGEIGRPEEITVTPSAQALLNGMRLQANGDTMAYTHTLSGGVLTIAPENYSAASTYRIRAPKGTPAQLAENGYSLQVALGRLRLEIGEGMDTARGLDLTFSPVNSTIQNLWTKQKTATGLWNIQSDSTSGDMTLIFDCTAAGTDALVLMRYDPVLGKFEQVSIKKWYVENGVVIAERMSAGIYGVVKE